MVKLYNDNQPASHTNLNGLRPTLSKITELRRERAGENIIVNILEKPRTWANHEARAGRLVR